MSAEHGLGPVVCLTVTLGLLTPPYDFFALISCTIGKVLLTETLKPMAPMFGAELLVVLVIAHVPDLALYLLRLLAPNLVSLH